MTIGVKMTKPIEIPETFSWGLPIKEKPIAHKRTLEEYEELFKNKIVISFTYDPEQVWFIVNGEPLGIVQSLEFKACASNKLAMPLHLKIKWHGICTPEWWDRHPEAKRDTEAYEIFSSGFERYRDYVREIKEINPWAEIEFSD